MRTGTPTLAGGIAREQLENGGRAGDLSAAAAAAASVTDESPRVASRPRSHVRVSRGHQQLLDMFPRSASGFLPAFELVLFLLVLSGCPEATYPARTKGRWNKGGKRAPRSLVFLAFGLFGDGADVIQRTPRLLGARWHKKPTC